MLSVTTLEGHSAHGLSDLARAFLFAGSRSLLASHWSVDSKDGKNSSAMPGGSHYSHPVYWAPFTVIGDGAAMSP